jgi:ketol-acid reductoisomerase
MAKIDVDVIGRGLGDIDNNVDNAKLIAVNEDIRSHPIELVGKTLRHHMTAMKKII